MDRYGDECSYCFHFLTPDQFDCRLQCAHILCKPCLELIKAKNFLMCPICQKEIKEKHLNPIFGKKIGRKSNDINSIANKLESSLKTYSELSNEIKKFKTDSEYLKKVIKSFQIFKDIYLNRENMPKDPIERLENFRNKRIQDYNDIEAVNIESLLITNFKDANEIFQEIKSVAE